MTATAPSIDNFTLLISEEIHVRASLEATFEALLEELGSHNTSPDGKPMPLVIEAKPGGRWYRDMGGDNGHFWGHVKAIVRPTLLEIVGPMFMSNPVSGNIQYRLSESNGETVIKFRHSMFGLIEDVHRQGTSKGWEFIHGRLRARFEGGKIQ
jgi:uncharacterized protein YndB with AHSA1/START domain